MDFKYLENIDFSFLHQFAYTKRILGSGTFGTVFQVCSFDGKSYAIKVSKIQNNQYSKYENIYSQFICRPHDVHRTDKYQYLVFTYHTSDLQKSLKFPYNVQPLQLFRKILSALDYLHKRNIVHGDVKPANILISRKNYFYQLGDFSLSGQSKHQNQKKKDVYDLCISVSELQNDWPYSYVSYKIQAVASNKSYLQSLKSKFPFLQRLYKLVFKCSKFEQVPSIKQIDQIFQEYYDFSVILPQYHDQRTDIDLNNDLDQQLQKQVGKAMKMIKKKRLNQKSLRNLVVRKKTFGSPLIKCPDCGQKLLKKNLKRHHNLHK